MAEENRYKSTINLPKTDFAMKADLARREPGMLAEWETKRRYAQIQQRTSRTRARVHPARRSAVCERRDPYRPRGQQDPEGHRRQVASCSPVSARRMCRAGTATGCRSRSRSRRTSARSARKSTRRRSARMCREYATKQIDLQRADFKRLGRARRLGKSLSHDGFQATRRT